jgi:hypothetical protein
MEKQVSQELERKWPLYLTWSFLIKCRFNLVHINCQEYMCGSSHGGPILNIAYNEETFFFSQNQIWIDGIISVICRFKLAHMKTTGFMGPGSVSYCFNLHKWRSKSLYRAGFQLDFIILWSNDLTHIDSSGLLSWKALIQ